MNYLGDLSMYIKLILDIPTMNVFMGSNGDLKEIVMESGHLFWIKTVV